MSDIERRNDEEMPEEPMPEEPTPSGVNDDAPVLGRVPPPVNAELARRVPEEPTPSGVPMPNPVLPPPRQALALRTRTPLVLAGQPRILSRVSPDIDASQKRARSSSVEPPPSKRRKTRSVARFFDMAAEEDEVSGDDSEPRRVRRADEDADGEEGEDDDEETPFDREFIDDEPIHQGSHFTIPDETDADALEALAASFKTASASFLFAVSPSSASPFSTSTSSHDLVHNLFAPAPSDERTTVQRGEWIRLKKKPYEGKLAWVVSSQRFIVANLDGVGDADPCSRVTYNAPLLATAYPRVLPNPDELLRFKQSKESYFKQATFVGTTSALVEGVRVVVVAGQHKGDVGYIVVIREIADEKYRGRWAKIQEEYNGIDTVDAKADGIFVKIMHLRRHALDPPTPFRVLDRVQVITGIEHRGAIGRIVQESGAQDIIEVEHRRVTRYFMEGDFVCVTEASKNRRGGRCGLVVKGQRNFDGSDIYDDSLWRAPSRDANFDLNPAPSMSSWAALMPQPDIVDLQTFSAQKSSSSGEAQFIDLSGALGSVVREGRPVGFDPTGALRSAVGHDLEKQRREGKHHHIRPD
ncbi:hypothetical protein B0H14DRAFT_2563644 [Mycena olivaceomarginata]|nr:hypothetical protein B0H14DRAFT_2563644 [Mycena olivaceomarginata]